MATDAGLCVICGTEPATTREHVPAELFFDRPLPGDRISVPSCKACNHGTQQDDEYLRAFLMLLRGDSPASAIEKVRQRTIRQLERPEFPGLRRTFRQASELRLEEASDGTVELGLHTRPDGSRLRRVLDKYARGLYFAITGTPLSPEAWIALERLFNQQTRPADYWEPLLAAAAFARRGEVRAIGSGGEFRYAFLATGGGDALAALVMEFYGAFPYVAILYRPGVKPGQKARVPW